MAVGTATTACLATNLIDEHSKSNCLFPPASGGLHWAENWPSNLEWNHPTVTAIADSKRRVIMPGERPIDVYACQDECNAHFLLGRLTKPAPPKILPDGSIN